MRFGEPDPPPEEKVRFRGSFCWVPRRTESGTWVWLEPVIEKQIYLLHGIHPENKMIRYTRPDGWFTERRYLPENAPLSEGDS